MRESPQCTRSSEGLGTIGRAQRLELNRVDELNSEIDVAHVNLGEMQCPRTRIIKRRVKRVMSVREGWEAMLDIGELSINGPSRCYHWQCRLICVA